jgi:hypothetical protein
MCVQKLQCCKQGIETCSESNSEPSPTPPYKMPPAPPPTNLHLQPVSPLIRILSPVSSKIRVFILGAFSWF